MIIQAISDDELIFLTRQKHAEALTMLVERMQPKQDRMIYKMLAMHKYCGLDYDDLKIVALQSLYLAIDSYHPQRNQFDAYYHFLLQREIVNELKRFSSKMHQPLTTAYSLDYEIEEGSTMADIVGDEDHTIKQRLDNPFYILLESNDYTLTPTEKAILIYVRQGYSYSEIGKILKRNYRHISRIFQSLIARSNQRPDDLDD